MFNSLANKLLFNLVKEKPLYILLSLVLSLGNTIFSVMGTVLLVPVAVIFLGNSQEILLANNSPAVKYLFAICNSLAREYSPIAIAFLVALAYIFAALISYGERVYGSSYTKQLNYRMKEMGFGLLVRADLDHFYRHKVSDLLFKLNREIDKTALLIKSYQKFTLDLISIAFLLVCLLFISLPLTLISLVLIVIYLAINNKAIAVTKKQVNLVSPKSRAYNQIVIDFLTGIYHIKTNAGESQEYIAITNSLLERNRAELKAQSFSALMRPLNEITTVLAIAILFLSSYYLFAASIQEIALIFAVYTAVFLKLMPIVDRANANRLQIASCKISAEVVASFFNDFNQPVITSGKTKFSKLHRSIEFRNVTFAYPYRARLVLDKINLPIFSGETIALVGSSGSGKSTIVNLLARLYEPIEGTIAIDNKNIQEYSLSSLRNNISIITQDSFLFNNSLAYNLTYGLQNVSREKIIAATKKTKADEFIAQLSQGLDTKINENFKLIISEPQKQLIAITRALLRNPELVILDLTIENLDKTNRQLIQNALDILCRDRTNIIITDRLATIQKADRIIILEKGKVIESGTHQQLLQTGNFYKRMYASQFKTSQQSHQQQLAKRISKKLARQTNNNLSDEIRHNLNSLLNYLQLVNEGLIEDKGEQSRILDESYQSAKNMLASLREYEKKISRRFKKKDPPSNP